MLNDCWSFYINWLASKAFPELGTALPQLVLYISSYKSIHPINDMFWTKLFTFLAQPAPQDLCASWSNKSSDHSIFGRNGMIIGCRLAGQQAIQPNPLTLKLQYKFIRLEKKAWTCGHSTVLHSSRKKNRFKKYVN